MKTKVWMLVLSVSVAAVAAASAEDAGAVFGAPVAALQTAVRESNEKLENAVVSDRTSTVSVPLNAKTVKCSSADYSAMMLKVLVPDLAGLTVLNHRNTNEGAPCVAAGVCSVKLGPKTILEAGEGVDQIKVRVVLRKQTSIQGEVCHVSLVETVATTIRGVPFFHERVQEVPQRTAADCR